MSFILDALKKSESDRQRQSGPSLFEVKVAPPRRTLPVWAVAIAVLLGINVIVVSWMLLRHAPQQRPAVPAAAPSPSPPATGAGTAATTAPMVAAPVAATGGRPVPAPSPSSSAMPPASPDMAARPAGTAHGAASSGAAAMPPPPASAAAAPPATSPDQAADQAPADGNPSDYAPAVEPAAGSGAPEGTAGALPLYQQIVTSAGLPALHLDLHVFASRPKDRFVMINMQRVGEGDTLSNGVQVDAIRPDGVVLTYHGTRFLLPRN